MASPPNGTRGSMTRCAAFPGRRCFRPPSARRWRACPRPWRTPMPTPAYTTARRLGLPRFRTPRWRRRRTCRPWLTASRTTPCRSCGGFRWCAPPGRSARWLRTRRCCLARWISCARRSPRWPRCPSRPTWRAFRSMRCRMRRCGPLPSRPGGGCAAPCPMRCPAPRSAASSSWRDSAMTGNGRACAPPGGCSARRTSIPSACRGDFASRSMPAPPACA